MPLDSPKIHREKRAEQVCRWPRIGDVATLSLLAFVALALGIALHSLAVDDAFITYRYAHNLARGQGFTYNVGRPILSTTAPLYALLLAAGALVWPDLPTLANTLSAVAFWSAATLLFLLACGEKAPCVGALAALFLIAYPLLWLSLGLETGVLLALAMGAMVAYRRGRLLWTAALLALATLTRGDGLILAAVVAADYAVGLLLRLDPRSNYRLRRLFNPAPGEGPYAGATWRVALSAVGVYVAGLLPFLAWLTWQFWSPLPATLGAKIAQSALGITGFYPHTTYVQGLEVLARARLAQSPLYWLFVPAIVIGLIVMWREAPWVRLVVAWGAAHLVGYALLGVTPYQWYYVPLVPGLVCSAALGIVKGARWLAQRKGFHRSVAWGVGGLWAMALLAAVVRSDWAMVQALEGPAPPPEYPVSKVLPETKVDLYQQVGRWLRDHTPADAVVGVTEVGVIGYYAERSMVDFLGLLEPEVASAVARGDLYWALLRYQPDYLALTAISPLYAYDLRADPWFQAAYTPVQAFEDPRFWGSPMTVYQRRLPRATLVEPTAHGLPDGAIRLDVDFDGKIRLLGAVAGEGSARPGDVLALTLYWQALGRMDYDYAVFVHLLGEYDRVIAQRDGPPGLGAWPTGQWAPGQVVANPYLVALPEAAYAPDRAVWEVGLYDPQTGRRLETSEGRDNVRFGQVSVLPAAKPLRLDFGPVALTGYSLDRLALSPREQLQVTLHWEGEGPYQVTVQLTDEAGKVMAQAKGNLEQEVYLLTLTGVPDGAYDLEVLVAHPATGQTLPLLGEDGQPRADRARLTKVRIYP